jgi:ElaB/YqjD/DUF883 family membrane-anchored ribosome-binding protein
MSELKQDNNQSLVPINSSQHEEFSAEAFSEYQQKLQEIGSKAKEFLTEKFTLAGEKIKELSNKDPQDLIEDAKEFARKNPGQAILISAAAGLVLGILLRGRR